MSTGFDIPFLGNLVLCLILVSAAYTFAMSLGAARGRPRLLGAARLGMFATCAFIVLAVAVLAYAFQVHDFRIVYVSRYSDRSMPWYYLITSLWGGQDGSLLWWLFLLAGYTGACVRWLRGRYLELQPLVLATLDTILAFFAILMLFAANPFATHVAAAPADGEGLNPLLQNYWMVIHPPALYMGFVGWSVPFAFVVAALGTGRLHDEWIEAARPWAMIAWTFLSLGLLLGCVWSYEELGWGGYWAWDPVENASFMPWLVGTAYLHSAIVQERYGMLKVWNVFLMCLTYFMTIFGTFLTRSGMIASVHSFARSDIGIYFVYMMAVIVIVCATLIVWRLPKLRADHRIEALLSREFMFLLNNWMLLGMMLFVLGATTWPLITDLFWSEEITVGPGFYNFWMVPLGLMLLFLMGVGPLVSWRKATGSNLARAAMAPLIVGGVVMVAHIFFGHLLGYPAVIEPESVYFTATNDLLKPLQSVAPVLSSSTCALVAVTILQEFWRGARVRMRKGESFPVALAKLMNRARRRYGGYVVHLGVVIMYFGFTGAAYDTEKEAALRPGQTMDVAGYELRYDRPRDASDPNKRMLFTDMTLLDEGEEVGRVSPAKFIYRTHPEMPTTEVSIRSRADADLYVIMSTVDQQTERATFRIVVRPFVIWIWIGGFVLLLGCLIAMWPSAKDVVKQGRRRRRRRGAAAAVALLAAGLALAPAGAEAQSSSLHAGHVDLEDPQEKELFHHLLCQCGDCERLPLDTCICGWAEDARSELSVQLEAGSTVEELIQSYRAQWGPAAIAIPPDEGSGRALWAVPLVALAIAGVGIVFLGRRWKQRSQTPEAADTPKPSVPHSPQESVDYDAVLDDELRRLEDDR